MMLELIQRAPSLETFQKQFASEQSCSQHLFHVKWPDGFVCPRCANRGFSRIETRRQPIFQCRRCRHQTSLLAGTVMEGSRTPLLKWYTAMFLLARTGVGCTAVRLSKIIRVTFKTAWLIMHKIRHAISEADAFIRLSGSIRINRDVYGRPFCFHATRRHPKEQPLFSGGSVDRDGNAHYIKMKLIPAEHVQYLRVKPSAETAFIDSHTDANTADTLFFPKHFSTRRFSSLATYFRLVQSWIRHTFKGIGRKYVQSYLNEFCYCVNEEQAGRSPFERLPKICVAYGTVTQAMLRSLPPV